MKNLEKKLLEHLSFLYGEEKAPDLTNILLSKLDKFQALHPQLSKSTRSEEISERDVILITYGDMVHEKDKAPLNTLNIFLQEYVSEFINSVHILPFFPYSSDDGFSVIDYREIDPNIGTWKDVAELSKNFRLMFDAVVNHISSESAAFQGFLKGEAEFQNFFSVVEPGTDLSGVFRPRATPLLTPFETVTGEKLLWTTFSADQIDLNFANPDVLFEVIEILLFYAAHGAEFIRLDAITYVWKEIGTSCINLPRTHRIVQIMRTVLDIAAPKVLIITETNVPHEDNIAYFGDGNNEAQMVYNFALPILTLHAFHNEDVSTLSEWVSMLDLPSSQATFFNFLAGHDGIGMLPVKNILSLDELNNLVSSTEALGGFVSYKSNEDGSQSPYELNINYLDALGNDDSPEEEIELIANRFLASQAIMLSLRGVPGIYFHSLFGSKNWKEGVAQTERHRTINRQKVQLRQIEAEIANRDLLRHHVFTGYENLIKARISNPAFHPHCEQEILFIHHAVFVLLRTSLNNQNRILCLINVSAKSQEIVIDPTSLSLNDDTSLADILSQKIFPVTEQNIKIKLAQFEILWLSC